MKKRIKKIIFYLLEVILLVVLTLLLVLQCKHIIDQYVLTEVQKIFHGKVDIKDIRIRIDKIYLLNVMIEDAFDPKPGSLLCVKKIEIPLPYHWINDLTSPIPEIRVSGLSLNLELNSKNEWNIIKNIVRKKTSHRKPIKLPFRTLFIKDSFSKIRLSLKNEVNTFRLNDIFARLDLLGDKILFSVNGKEENIGICSSKGDIGLKNKDFNAVNSFSEISLKNDFNKRFIKKILPFISHYKFKGSLGLDIPVLLTKGVWTSPKYNINFKDFNFFAKEDSLGVKNLSGNIYIEKKNILAEDLKGIMQIKKILLPFTGLYAKSHFDNKYLDVNEIQAKTLNGDMKGNVHFVFDDLYKIELNFSNAGLPDVISLYRDKGESMDGLFFLDTVLKASKKNNWEFNAKGKAHIRKGKLFKLPLFAGVFNFLNFELPDKEEAKKANAVWSYNKGDLYLNEIEIESKNVNFYGEGSVDNSGKLDFLFTTELSRSKLLSIPLVGDITRDISNEIIKHLVTLRINGSIENPKFSKESVERIPKKAAGFFFNVLKAIASPLTGNGKSTDTRLKTQDSSEKP